MSRYITLSLSTTATLDTIYALEALRVNLKQDPEIPAPLGRSNDKALRALTRRIFSGMALALAENLDIRGITAGETDNDDILSLSVAYGGTPSGDTTLMMREHLESALGFGVMQAAWAMADKERSDTFGKMYLQCLGRFRAIFSNGIPSRITPD